MNGYSTNFSSAPVAETRPQDGFIITYSGTKFYPCHPKVDEIILEDIAHSLSLTCRWGGHCHKFFSVAQHSINCAAQALKWPDPKVNPLRMLFHDASEGYMTDLPRPIKRQFPEFKSKEDDLMKVIGQRFDFEWPMTKEEHDLDNRMLATEAAKLFYSPYPMDVLGGYEPLHDVTFGIMTADEAERAFLWYFERITRRFK